MKCQGADQGGYKMPGRQIRVVMVVPQLYMTRQTPSVPLLWHLQHADSTLWFKEVPPVWSITSAFKTAGKREKSEGKGTCLSL